MKRMVYSHLERAQLGGVPGLVPLVRGYLEVVLPPQDASNLEDGQAQNVPVWPLIFCCMRAGGSKAACQAVAENRYLHHVVFNIDGSSAVYSLSCVCKMV